MATKGFCFSKYCPIHCFGVVGLETGRLFSRRGLLFFLLLVKSGHEAFDVNPGSCRKDFSLEDDIHDV